MNSLVISGFPARASIGTARNKAQRPAPLHGNSIKGLSTLLLAAMLSALMVLADQLISTWADAHLLAAWATLWALSFVTLVMFSGTARKFAGGMVRLFDSWASEVAQRRADARLWAVALSDARVMTDLQAALARRQDDDATVLSFKAARLHRKLAQVA